MSHYTQSLACPPFPVDRYDWQPSTQPCKVCGEACQETIDPAPLGDVYLYRCDAVHRGWHEVNGKQVFGDIPGPYLFFGEYVNEDEEDEND